VSGLNCPYCGCTAQIVPGETVYKKPGYGPVYVCSNFPACDAYVGVHKGTTKALGTLANRQLRSLRNQCHELLDPIWQEGNISRPAMYEAIAKLLNLKEFHVATMDEQHARDVLRRGIAFRDVVIAKAKEIQHRRLARASKVAA